MMERGTIEIHLKELPEKTDLSKNKFCQRAEPQRSQLKGYLSNNWLLFYGKSPLHHPPRKHHAGHDSRKG